MIFCIHWMLLKRIPVWLCLPLKSQKTHAVCPPSRYFAEFDHESTRFSRFISSTFGNISLSQALEEIVSIPVDKLLMIYDLTAGYFYECKGCFDAYQSLLPMFSNFMYLFFGVEKQPFVVEKEDQGCHVTGLLMGCWVLWHSRFCVHSYKESMKRANMYAHYVYSMSIANYACRLHKLCLHPWGPSLEVINWENKGLNSVEKIFSFSI